MPPRKRRRSQPGADPAMSTPSGQIHFVSPELDLHGMRAADARSAILHHLSMSHDDRLPVVRFNHGHGEGVLKQIVSDVLASSPLVARHYPDVNPGLTVAELRYGDAHRAYNRRSNYSITPKPERWK